MGHIYVQEALMQNGHRYNSSQRSKMYTIRLLCENKNIKHNPNSIILLAGFSFTINQILFENILDACVT